MSFPPSFFSVSGSSGAWHLTSLDQDVRCSSLQLGPLRHNYYSYSTVFCLLCVLPTISNVPKRTSIFFLPTYQDLRPCSFRYQQINSILTSLDTRWKSWSQDFNSLRCLRCNSNNEVHYFNIISYEEKFYNAFLSKTTGYWQEYLERNLFNIRLSFRWIHQLILSVFIYQWQKW